MSPTSFQTTEGAKRPRKIWNLPLLLFAFLSKTKSRFSQSDRSRIASIHSVHFSLRDDVRNVCGFLLLPFLFFMSCGEKKSIDFNADIRPILSDRCWNCHGPDEESREADLRLDIKDGWKGMEHELFARITTDDPDDIMPPPDSKLILTEAEIQTLKDWIDQGAEWQPHWAFIPPSMPEIPGTSSDSWGNNSIDRFVQAKWEKQGLTPSPPADKATLLRRVSLDVTGLPPTPDELDAFLSDESPEAFDRVLDRLFASPHYGEHMAVDWLDVARYADTHGYQADAYRPHWPWRDWVIEAFNDNMPFDQFVSWQLAGDQMSQPSRDQLIATGFNRNHAQNGEGGIVQEEFRVEYVADRAQTFSTAFLGLTMQCARCHDHKYDPISQKEFYSLFSFFNQVPEAGQITWNFSDMPGPTLLLSEPEEEVNLHQIKQEIDQLEQAIQTYEKEQISKLETWLSQQSKASEFPPGLIAHYPLEQASPQKVRNLVDARKSGKIVDPLNDRFSDPGPEIIDGKKGKGLLLHGDEAITFPEVGRFSRADAFSVGMWVNIPTDLKNGVIFHSNKGTAIYTFKGYQVSVEADKFDVRIAHDFPASSIHLLSQSSVPRDQWVHLMLTYDGSSTAAGTHLYVNGKAMEMSVERDHLHKDIIFHPKKEGGNYINTMLKIGARWRGKGFTGGKVDEVLVFDRALQATEVAAIVSFTPWEQAVEANQDWLPAILADQDKTYQSMWDSLQAKRWQEVRLTESFPELMIMADQEELRPTFVLTRGVYDAHAEEVSQTTPQNVLSFPEQYPANRLGLARWLFHPNNPLPSRVLVNRFWQHYFGRGLVKTTEDFGSQGELPSHPKLLDWLALEFEASGWDVQQLQRLILSSAVYQQTSQASEELIASDPDNQWLARGPKSRLSAEMMRDQVLAASGLLVKKIGGPPVHPYQPEGWWTLNRMSGTYSQGEGEDLYRRSMYTFWKRTNPPPSMNTFDAPSRSYCVVRRQKTTTPLQALVLMNDPQFLEAARVLGERIIREGGKNPKEKITFAYRLLTSAFPSKKELELLEKQFEESFSRYTQQADETKWLLHTGDSPLDQELNPAEIAAYSVVATTIMNLDASMTKR